MSSINLKTGLLSILQQKKSEYLNIIDPNVQAIDEVQFQLASKIVDEALQLNDRLTQVNSLYDDLQDIRKKAEYYENKYNEELAIKDGKIKKLWTETFETKYQNEVEINKGHVRNIAQMKSQITQLEEEIANLRQSSEMGIVNIGTLKKPLSDHHEPGSSNRSPARSVQQARSPMRSTVELQPPPTPKPALGQLNPRLLSLSTLTKLIKELAKKKAQYDAVCESSQQPLQTMESYLYIYFADKVNGNQPQVIEWTLTLINSISHLKE